MKFAPSTTRLLYRGSLSSCNYACGYCPFAKTRNTKAELDRDRQQLHRFVDWVERGDRPLGVLFTPWGEAIILRYYREAMVRLSLMSHVRRVAIQTNLSGHLDDLGGGDVERLAIWATYHSSETDPDRFLARCQKLDLLGIRYSVGMVGFREHFQTIAELRKRLPSHVYLWINVPKSSGIIYSDEEQRFLESIDPYFRWNGRRWSSRGRACSAGTSSLSIDGEGDVRRCHFVDEVIGNIHRDDVWPRLKERTCPNATCGCHIGYVNRDDFPLRRVFGDGLLERIPAEWPEVNAEMMIPKAVQSLPVVDDC
ncbi:STM4011 family radical SAM protein [Rhodopirellula sp. MGV]|uniref:STM4011 family radical SAM protein n=1 Tax=Rhodopirellula sp. MGV TaxID=2023130 RepID=UPI0018E931E5|nr:STM4011 family radical SAM protein [Rhodopirellula sp. MGV]